MTVPASTHRGDALAVMALWIPLFALGMVIHESFHALAVLLLGSHPVLVIRPWAFALVPLTISGIHVQPVPALDPTGQFLDNLAGPGVAAALFGVIALNLPRGIARRATTASALGLLFYAFVEPVDVLIDGRMDLGALTAPEFNYGVPLLIAVAFAATTVRPQFPQIKTVGSTPFRSGTR